MDHHEAALRDVPNSTAMKARLSEEIVAGAVSRLERPYRVVVSGPDSYNDAARGYLDECGVDRKFVTILSA